MKRIVPLALATASLAFMLALAAPAEARDRDSRHRDEHRRADRHRIEQRGHQRHRVDHRRHQRVDHRRHDRRGDRYDRPGRRYDHRRHGRFDIPRRIQRDHGDRYRSYFDGTTYFAPHGHRHSVYRFPVFDHGSWSYRSHNYCGGDLFHGHGSIGFHGRRFSIRLGY